MAFDDPNDVLGVLFGRAGIEPGGNVDPFLTQERLIRRSLEPNVRVRSPQFQRPAPDIPLPRPRPSSAPSPTDDGLPDDWITPAPSAAQADGLPDDWITPAPRDPLRWDDFGEQPTPDLGPMGPVPNVPVGPMGGRPAPPPEPAPGVVDAEAGVDVTPSLTDYPIEFGKGFAEGGKNLLASAAKGYGAGAVGMARDQLAAMDKPDGPVDDSPEARAAYRLRRGVIHPSPEVQAERRASLEAQANRPLTEHPLWKAGEAIEGFGKDALAPKHGFEGSWTRDIGGGFGSLAAGLGISFIPGVGPAAAGTTFFGAGAGEAADRAAKHKASEEDIILASRYGTIAGATDLVDIWLPALGSTGRMLGFARRVGTRAMMGAFAEGGQEGVQQLIQNAIAKGIYKPDQDLLEDVPRSAAIGAIVGSVTSGGFAALQGKDQPQPRATGEADAGAGIEGEILSPDRPGLPPKTTPETEIVDLKVNPPTAGALPPPVNSPPNYANPIQPEPGAPDAPFAEPIGDLLAQARDLLDEDSPRQAVYLSAENVERLAQTPEAARVIVGSGVPIPDFDGKGGVLIVRDQEVAQAAITARDNGVPIQTILGTLTGAGQGETVTSRDEAPAAQDELAAPDRDVRTVTPEQAIERREEGIAGEAGKEPDGLPDDWITPEPADLQGEADASPEIDDWVTPEPKPAANTDALRTYAKSIVGDHVRSVSLIGSTAAKGQGRDVDLLYDLGEWTLPKDTNEAADAVTRLIEERVPNINLDGYDAFFKVGDRYFHLSGGAGRTIVENTDYAREQAGKPTVELAKRAEPAEQPGKPASAPSAPSVAIDDEVKGIYDDIFGKEPTFDGVPEGYEVEPATRVASEQEARIKGGQYKAVARRLKPWSAVDGYGDTPLLAQNNALKRLKVDFRLREPVMAPKAEDRYEVAGTTKGGSTILRPKKAKSDWTEIGKNHIGQTLYEDQRGVRSYIENGVRVTEAVQMRPTRSGLEQSVDREGKPEWEVVPAAPRTKAELASSAAKGVGRGTKKSIQALGELFSPKNKLGEGISFDEDTWRKAKPIFLEAATEFAGAFRDMTEFARMLVNELRAAGFGMDVLKEMRPYLERFTQEVKNGTINLGETPADANIKDEETADGRGPRPGKQSSEVGEGPVVPAGDDVADGKPVGEQRPTELGEPSSEDAGGPESAGSGQGTGARPGASVSGSGEGVPQVGDDAAGRPRTGGAGVATPGAGGRPGHTSLRPNYHIADPERLIGGGPKGALLAQSQSDRSIPFHHRRRPRSDTG